MSKCMGTIHAHHRILITGAPLQNNLLEIWNLMDWLCDHRLLGKKEEFTRHFRTPIEEGQDKKASDEVQLKANCVTQELHDLVASVMLRREKSEVFKGEASPMISKKTEIVLWW